MKRIRKPTYCLTCGCERNGCCKPGQCVSCRTKDKRKQQLEKEIDYLTSNGYTIMSGPIRNNLGKAVYSLIRKECGHEYTAVFHNIRKQIKKLGITPCTICGAEKRITRCLEGFLNKYGKTYDEQKYEDYRYEVRKASEKVYRKHKLQLNPDNLKRGRTSYHLDHKVPIIECFMRGISIERASCVENLEILPYVDNISKHSRTFSEDLAIRLQKSPE